MEATAEYFEKARNLNLTAFKAIHPYLFLFKHAKTAIAPQPELADINYATRAVAVNFDPIPNESRIVVVRKNPDNPFPDRLTIGRAPNCDVIIRMAFISKVHAHLFIPAGEPMTLRDNNAANGTSHNYQKLEPGSSRNVKLGDILGFGALAFELMDAERLYALARGTKTMSLTPRMARGA